MSSVSDDGAKDKDAHKGQDVGSFRAHSSGEIVLASPPGWATYGPLLGFAIIVAVLALTFVTVERTVFVSGKIIPSGGDVQVTGQSPGIVSEIRIRNHQTVRRGDILMIVTSRRATANGDDVSDTVSDLLELQITASEMQIQQTRAEYDANSSELAARIRAANDEISSKQRQLSFSQQRLELVESQVRQMQTLVDRGFGSQLELTRRREVLLLASNDVEAGTLEVSKAESEHLALSEELRALAAREGAEIARLSASIADLRGRAALGALEGAEAVRAPVGGRVSYVGARPGQRVTPGLSLVSIVPDADRLEGELYVSPQDVRLMQEGDRLTLRIDAFPHQRFGEISATIRTLSVAPALETGGAPAPNMTRMYLATLALAETPRQLEERGFQLRPEMTATARFGTGRVSLWRLAFESLSGGSAAERP